jgi:hypothetical protein
MNISFEHFLQVALALLALAYVGMILFHQLKPLPPGLDTATPMQPVRDVMFLADTTYTDAQGNPCTERRIIDEMLRIIAEAERLVVLDMFLFNDFAGDSHAGHRAISAELAGALVARRRDRPQLTAVFITDPFNTFYGSTRSDYLQALESAGVRVVMTDLDPLRDPNPLWSGLWRICCQWLDRRAGYEWLPNPVGSGRVKLRSYLEVLNFKANHRKTLVADSGTDWVGLVSSANPHDASSRHGNVALRFHGNSALSLLETELAVAVMSGAPAAFSIPERTEQGWENGQRTPAHLRILTESRIRDEAMELIRGAAPGDRLDVAMFYLSHRTLLNALLEAHKRGVNVRVLLDPNRHAFGLEKSGIPNRQTALEMHAAGIPVRWCDTRGEQCHSKYVMRHNGDSSDLLIGSANFTRRNLDNYNLETSVHLRAPSDFKAMRDAQAHFDRLWNNPQGEIHSLPYERYADHSRLRYWRYRVMEATGLSSF